MSANLCDIPNEILELIVFHLIDGPWKSDVQDFLSFTSTCQRFYQLSRDERYWQKLAARRDPTNKKSRDDMTWLDYCKEIYLMRTIPSDVLLAKISRFNKNYFCTIEKVLLWPDKIRIYIDERGNYSLGGIQPPKYSRITFIDENNADIQTNELTADDSKFSIADERCQYLGYLDYFTNISSDHIGKTLTFEYGIHRYSVIKLFHVDETFINDHNLLPLLTKKVSQH